ncbi:anti-sigma-F factor Fin [Risungbinella massiliensis]|uniref:anti-sigma-F factor Fin n=1 Tax=Risungbinella massiliensis TaxID=1329796 RepID=UPI0005CBF3DF|nr:anti-sigma-F factor Fin [Risungbinella massiliensis]
MAIYYQCKHCQSRLGMLEKKDVTEQELGFDRLTQEERQDIIFNDLYGDTYVHITCESCQETLDRYPERNAWSYLIQ